MSRPDKGPSRSLHELARRVAPQRPVERLGRPWRGDAPREELLGGGGVAIEDMVEAVTSEEAGAVEPDAGEGAAGDRVGVDCGVGVGTGHPRRLGRPTEGAHSDGDVGAERKVGGAGEGREGIGGVQDEHDGVDLAAHLRAERGAHAADRARRAPLAARLVLGHDQATAALEAPEEAGLDDGEEGDAVGAVEHAADDGGVGHAQEPVQVVHGLLDLQLEYEDIELDIDDVGMREQEEFELLRRLEIRHAVVRAESCWIARVRHERMRWRVRDVRMHVLKRERKTMADLFVMALQRRELALSSTLSAYKRHRLLTSALHEASKKDRALRSKILDEVAVDEASAVSKLRTTYDAVLSGVASILEGGGLEMRNHILNKQRSC